MMRLFRLRDRFRERRRRRRFIRNFFDRGRLLCEQCGTETPVQGLEPLSFHHCGRCGFNNFTPLAVSDFLLFEPLGAGGIASVYKAYSRRSPGALLAVKIVRRDKRDQAEVLKTFLEECEIHKQIPPHPNIVRYVDSGCVGGEYFYAMEFVQGERLRRRLEGAGRLPAPEAFRILSQILEAVRHILAAGYLYRDVNAGNVIVKGNGTAVLIDMGLTMRAEEARQEKKDRAIWGTGEFIPPERIHLAGENEGSVIYSLGMLLYYMLSGKPYVKSATVEGMVLRHISTTRLAFTPALLPQCSEEVVNLVMAMTKPNPEERLSSFEALSKALDAVR